MRTLITNFLLATLLCACDPEDPYAEGSHWDYSIQCEEGFLWKTRSHHGTIPVLHTDGTHMRCGETRH